MGSFDAFFIVRLNKFWRNIEVMDSSDSRQHDHYTVAYLW